MRFVVALLTSFMLQATIAAGGDRSSTAQPVDASPTGIRGAWISSADPTGYLYISEDFRSISVDASWYVADRAGKRFQALGYPSGQEYVCLVRSPSSTGDAFDLGLLRFRVIGDGTIDAVFSDLRGIALRQETWTVDRRRSSGDAPVVRREESPHASVPGETTFAEELPELLTKVPVVYPVSALERHIEGTVLLQALVGTDGFVKDTRVVKSIPELDAAASVAVRQYRFKPAMANGVPVAVWVAVPVRFSLH